MLQTYHKVAQSSTSALQLSGHSDCQAIERSMGDMGGTEMGCGGKGAGHEVGAEELSSAES